MRFDLLAVAMLCWGLAVFLPKVAGRDLSPAGVVLSNALGYVICLPLVWRLLEPRDRHLGPAHAWGVLIGVLFVLGNLAFYRLLTTGHVSRLAPLTALYVAIPVLLGLALLGERLSLHQWAGVLLALLAGYLLGVERVPPSADAPLAGHQPSSAN